MSKILSKIVPVETYKYPNLPRYYFPAQVVTDIPDILTLFCPVGAPFWSGKDNQLHVHRHHTFSLLYPDRDYNVVLFWNADWGFRGYYVNVALPMQWDGQMCSYIDLDLDVQFLTEESVVARGGQMAAGVYVLDRDEYEERKIAYNYPVEIMERSEAALQEILRQIEIKAFPFDDSLVGWRPDAELGDLTGLLDKYGKWHFPKQ